MKALITPALIVIILIMTLTACSKNDSQTPLGKIRPAQLSVQDLTAAVGVSPFCAEAHFPFSCYARLVAITTDSTGRHRSEISTPSADKDFRLRVLLFSDPKSGVPQRITYAISTSTGGGGERFIQIEPETGIQRMTTNESSTFLYDIELKKHSETIDIHIELETSATPFSKTAS